MLPPAAPAAPPPALGAAKPTRVPPAAAGASSARPPAPRLQAPPARTGTLRLALGRVRAQAGPGSASAPAVKPPAGAEHKKATDPRIDQRQAERRRRKALAALGAVLAERFPAVFGDAATPPPLVIGIDRELRRALDGEYPHKLVKLFVVRWVRRPPYLAAIAVGMPRRNLAGEIVEPLRPEDIAFAAATLAARGASP
ncbi:MAG TPA: ProQ/FINO family protein [Acetobacteraceae bacterium]|nr:ProQ/FINO family protein [Acetobacteraceae bacterium]